MYDQVVIEQISFAVGAGPSRRPILVDTSLEVALGEWVAVMGPSGCGKSTLLHIVGGLRRPDSGSVTVQGIDVSSLSDRGRAGFRRRRIGLVFQQYNLIEDLTVSSNVDLPARLLGRPRRSAGRDAAELLERLGLGARADAWPSQLSGGEQQRVAIARALATRPAVVLADEPTGALDSAATAAVIDLLRAACDEGQTILMVTHDPSVAAAADRVAWMRDGTVRDAAPGDLLLPKALDLVGDLR